MKENWNQFPQAEPEPTLPGQNPATAMGNNAKDPWRPSFQDPVQAERRKQSLDRIRQRSVERDHQASPTRRQSQERQREKSMDRIERKVSQERRYSQDRRHSPERPREHSPRRQRSVGAEHRMPNFKQGHQASDRWVQNLPTGGSAQVFLVADANSLAQAASRLNFLEQGAIIAMDCHGWNLRAAAGMLCLLEVAFSDASGLQVFIFDILQLGELIQNLHPFFTNAHASKITADATTHATILAHKFGINLQGVIDAQWAYEALNGKPMVSSLEVLDWCGLAPSFFKDEATKIDRSPELWGHRPLSRTLLGHASQSVCMLHSASALIWRRLAYAFGPGVFSMVANASRQRAEMAAAAGWACRNAGLYTADQDYKQEQSNNMPERDESELDDWLAKRFGKQPADKGERKLRERSVARRAMSADGRVVIPEEVVRPGDSPRTAAWRAVVALHENPEGERQRSSSPTLETWLSRRGTVKPSGSQAARRASSVPTARDAKRQEESFNTGPLRPLDFDNVDHRRWTDIVDAEQAKEEDGDEDLFEELKQEEKRRLNQAELSSRMR